MRDRTDTVAAEAARPAEVTVNSMLALSVDVMARAAVTLDDRSPRCPAMSVYPADVAEVPRLVSSVAHVLA